MVSTPAHWLLERKKKGRRGHELPPPFLALSYPSLLPSPILLTPPHPHLPIPMHKSLEEVRGGLCDMAGSFVSADMVAGGHQWLWDGVQELLQMVTWHIEIVGGDSEDIYTS